VSNTTQRQSAAFHKCDVFMLCMFLCVQLSCVSCCATCTTLLIGSDPLHLYERSAADSACSGHPNTTVCYQK
jgi:hypothetical protein